MDQINLEEQLRIKSPALGEPVRPPATIPTPAAYQEAMGSPDLGEWKAAMDKEMLSISDHDVADLVPFESLPPGAKPIGSRWHFKSKATRGYEGKANYYYFICHPTIAGDSTNILLNFIIHDANAML